MSEVPIEFEDARVFLLNGMAFDVRVPAGEVAYGNWLKIVKADGVIVAALPEGRPGDLVIRHDAVAVIVRGELLRRINSGVDNAAAVVMPHRLN